MSALCSSVKQTEQIAPQWCTEQLLQNKAPYWLRKALKSNSGKSQQNAFSASNPEYETLLGKNMFWFSWVCFVWGCVCSSVQGNNKQDFPILADRTKALQRTAKKEKEVAALQKKWQPPGGGGSPYPGRGGRRPPPPPNSVPRHHPGLNRSSTSFKTTLWPGPVSWLLQSQELWFRKPPNSKEKLWGRKNQEGGGARGSKLRSPALHLPPSSFSPVLDHPPTANHPHPSPPPNPTSFFFFFLNKDI